MPKKKTASKKKSYARKKKSVSAPAGFKQYIGISRDHSASMHSIAASAGRDYNDVISSIQTAAKSNSIDTIVSVVKCGVGFNGITERETVNSNVQVLKPIDPSRYDATGGWTPLYDSVGELIEILQAVPDANDPNVSFLIMVITDGHDNRSRLYSGYSLGEKIRQLQATDRWTFTFRVPFGAKSMMQRQLGLPEGNILEWEQTTQGVERASTFTRSAVGSYFQSRSVGMKSSSSFYTADLSNVAPKTVRNDLENITDEVQFFKVQSTAASSIREFVEHKLRKPMARGTAFYQLTKKEKAVQDHKQICVRNRKSGAVYSGEEARDLLGIPKQGTIKLAPGDHGDFDIFIQSTSVNRKLVPGTEVLYWLGAAK